MKRESIRNRFRFSLAFLLLVMMVAAVSIPTIQWIHRFANSRPIQLAIEEFESRQYQYYEQMAPLTSREIVECLGSDQVLSQQMPQGVRSTIKQILDMKRIPNTCQLDMVSYRSGEQYGIDSVLIRLVITKNDVVHAVDIRSVEATPEMQPGGIWQHVALTQ